MGEHDWEHTVPKTTRTGARMSVTFRHQGAVGVFDPPQLPAPTDQPRDGGYTASVRVPRRGVNAMGEFIDKSRDKAQQARGSLKKKAGELSGDEQLRTEGQADKTKANLKQAGEKVKDAFRP